MEGFGTIACGMAPSMNMLIAARAVAGMGGGGSVQLQSTFVLYIPIPALPRLIEHAFQCYDR